MGQSLYLKIVLCLLLYLSLVIYKAPASLFSSVVDQFIPPLSISKFEGTVWQGCGRNTVVDVNGVAVSLGDLCWSLQGKSLLSLNPRLLISTQASTHSSYADVSVATDGSITILDLSAALPVSLLEPWVPLLVSGNISAAIDEVRVMGNNIESLLGQVQFSDVNWLAGDQMMPLGDYTADIALAEPGLIRVVSQDQDALLGLYGELDISLNGRYQSRLELSPKAGLAEEISNSLPFLGKKDAQGRIIVSEQGTW